MLIQLNLTSSREFLDKTLNIIVESDLNKTSLSVLHKSKILSVLLIFSYFFNCRRFHLTFFYVEILLKSMSIQLNLTSSRYKRFDQDMKATAENFMQIHQDLTKLRRFEVQRAYDILLLFVFHSKLKYFTDFH